MDKKTIQELYQNRNESTIKEITVVYGARFHIISDEIKDDTETDEECKNDSSPATWNHVLQLCGYTVPYFDFAL